MWKRIKYKRWIIAALAVSVVDASVISFVSDETELAGSSGLVQFFNLLGEIAFVLLFPISLPKLLILKIIGSCFGVSLIGGDSSLSHPMQAFIYGLGDLPVCYVYFLLFRVIYRRWQQVRQNELEIKGHRAR